MCVCMDADVYTVPLKTLVNKDCKQFGRKNFGKFKSIFIGNVMEVVKIGKKA